MAKELKDLFTKQILPKLSITKQESFHKEFTSTEWENLTESDFFTRTKSALGIPLHLVNSIRKEEEKIDVYEYCYFESNEWRHCDCQEIFNVGEVIVLKHQESYDHFNTFTQKCTPDIKTMTFLSSQMSNFVEIGIDLLMKIDVPIEMKVFMCEKVKQTSKNSFQQTLFSVLNKKGKYDAIDFLFKTDCEVPPEEVHNISRVKGWIRYRNLFHEYITKGDLLAIDDYLKKNPNLKYCNDKNNESACAKAIRMSDYDLYKHLQSRGLTVRSVKREITLFDDNKFLNYFRNNNLPFEKYLDQYLRIFKSKTLTRSQSETNASIEKVYEELRLVDGFEKVIKILCNCQDVLLVFDYHENDIRRICPYGTGTMKGLFDPVLNRLFISGGEGFEQMLGTAAHEMTHFVMQLVYDNNARPYSKNDAERRNKFDEIVYEIISKIQSSSNFENIIVRAYNSPEQCHAELIVRVNHVLAYYGNDEGRRILLAQAPKLLEYYENYIIPDLDKYLRSHYNRNNNTFITPFNQKIENLHVHFDKPNDPLAVSVEKIWRYPKEIANPKNLIIKTESVQLTCLKIFQNITKEESSFNLDNTYIVDSETYFANQQQVKFYFQNYELLVIADTSSKRSIQEWEGIANYVNDDIFKQFIFVLDKDKIWTSQEGTDEIEDSFEFNDFDENSRVFIIEKLKVNFQGQDVKLNQLTNFKFSPEKTFLNDDSLKNDNDSSYDLQSTSHLLKVNEEMVADFSRYDIKSPQLVDLRQKPEQINEKLSSENLESLTPNTTPVEDDIQVNESTKQSTENGVEPVEKFDLFNSMFSAQIVSDYLFNDVQVIVGTELSSLPSYIERFFKQKDYTFEQLYRILKEGKIKFFYSNESKDKMISLKSGQTFYLPDEKSILSSLSDDFLKSMFSSKYGSSDHIYDSIGVHILRTLLESTIFVLTQENGESLMVVKNEILIHLNNVSETYLEKVYESNNKYFDIYWFEKFDGIFFWRNTFGNENDDFLMNRSFGFGYNFSEYSLFDKLYYQKIILIAATAGMGKSSTLKNVARQIVKKNPSIWAPLIILNNRTEIFKNFTDNSSDPDYYLNFLIDLLQLKTNFEKVLFKFYCTYTDKVYLFLDGVDEISPTYTETLRKLINELSKTKIKHIILTTRFNLRKEIEKKLKTSSILFQSFSSINQIQCMKNNWKNTDIENIDEVASQVINLFKKMVPSRDYKDFIGIPLQIFMLAKLCENKIDLFSKDFQEVDRFFKEFTIYKMYEKFIEQKLDITFQEKAEFKTENQVVIKYSKDIKNSLILQFTNASVVTLLSEKESEYFLSQEEIRETETFINVIKNGESYEGIIDGVIDTGKPNFVHKTYAEYFFAAFLIKLRSWTDPAQTFFFKKILADIFSAVRFSAVRKFLNCHMENFCILTYTRIHTNIKDDFILFAAFLFAVIDGNLNIIKYLHKNIYNLNEMDYFTKNGILDAVEKKHPHVITFLLLLWENLMLYLVKCQSALNDAIDRNDIEFIKLLLTRCKPIPFDLFNFSDQSSFNSSLISSEEFNRSVKLWIQAELMLLGDYDLDEFLKIVKELASPASLDPTLT